MKKGVNISIKNGRRVVEGLGYYEPNAVNDLRELLKEAQQDLATSLLSNSGTKQAMSFTNTQ